MLHSARWVFLVLGTVVCFCAVAAAQSRAVQPSQAALDEAASAGAELPRLHSLLVSWRGQLLLERYFRGTTAARAANIKSASKSIISALIGIAIERGLLSGVQQPIASFFPGWPGAADGNRAKGTITLEDLLTMRSGLESTSNRNYGRWVTSRNWVRYVLDRPLVSTPGTAMTYSTGNTHLLSAILTHVTKTSTWRFAQDVLARPLGFTLPQWPRDPQGIYFGGNDMLLTPRQMLAFGELYLNRGRAKGQQIIPSAWVDASFIPRARSPVSDQLYGYGWWIRSLGGHDAYFAWGYGGQYIFVVPDLSLVVVTTSSTAASNAAQQREERRDYRRTVYDIVEQLILASSGESSLQPATP